jgi:ribulose-phosphate 3-epimerase
MQAKKIITAPSLLSAPSAELGRAVRELDAAGADWLHVDIMDGHFVPNLSFGPAISAGLRGLTGIPFDVHLMCEPPENFVDSFVEAGADLLTFHIEAAPHAYSLVQKIHGLGKKAGIALCPATPAQAVESIIPYIDLVLVMTVEPGFGGQKFIPGMADKIKKIAAMRGALGLSFHISVDGGIDEKTAKTVIDAGADVLVSGSAFFKAQDKKAFIASIRNA